jgi:hypothetical protein
MLFLRRFAGRIHDCMPVFSWPAVQGDRSCLYADVIVSKSG